MAALAQRQHVGEATAGGGLDRAHVVVLHAPRPRLDVGAIDRQRRQRLGDPVDVQQLAQALHLAGEGRRRLLELRARRHLVERLPGMRQPRERRLPRRVDEERGGVVEELVADRALDGPVAQRLAGVQDLLDPHVRGAGVAQARQVARRVGEPVGVVDAQPVDDAVAHELEDLAVDELEDRGVLDAHAGQVVDVEEAPVPAVVGVVVEDPRALALVGPPAVLLGHAHVVGDDVQHDLEALAGQRAQPLLPTERV